MPSLYLLGVVPSITVEDVTNHLRIHLDIEAECIIHPGDCTADLKLTNDDHEMLKNYRYLRIQKRLLAIVDENPVSSDGPPMVAMAASFSRPSVLGRTVTQLLYRNAGRKKAPNVYKVCLSGGPCAGKTTVLSTIMTKFPAHGVKVYAVPEAATILINGGLSFVGITPEQAFRYQLTLLAITLDLERNFLDLAMTHSGPCLVVCDRGAMDGKAYCDDKTWNAILAELNLDTVQLRDQQYDAVYHMVTAANGAEEYYGSESNAARLESLEEARILDDRSLNNYLGHPHLRIIDNSTDFPKKMERVVASISEGMGITIPTHGSYRRYLVRSPVPTILPVPTVQVEVEIAILQSSDVEPELRIIARQQNQTCSYFYQKLRTVNDKPVVTERKLTFEEYHELRKNIDNEYEIIQKSSLSFSWRNQYFEMGTFINPPEFAGMALLYIEIGSHTGEPELPPFIPIEREVTNDPQYTNMAISQTDFGAMDVYHSFHFNSTSSFSTEPDTTPQLPTIFQRASLKSPKGRSSVCGPAHIWPPKRDSCIDNIAFSWIDKRASFTSTGTTD